MAYVKRKAIHKTLEKTLKYIVNKNKTLGGTLVEGINCSIEPEVATKEMNFVKKMYGKEDKILAFHFQQSFKPGEVTPEIAHEIGIKFAKRISNCEYKTIVATHVDKQHIHNHIVMNSVNTNTGEKYNSCKKELHAVREISNGLAREYNLSVIKNNEFNDKEKKALTYNMWASKKYEEQYERWKEYEINNKSKSTFKFKIKKQINKLLRENKFNNWEEFVEAMADDGYVVSYKNSSGGFKKYTTFKAPGQTRFMRDKTLGDFYTRQAICERIEQKKNEIEFIKTGIKGYKFIDFDIYKFKFKPATLGNNLALTGIIIKKMILGFDKKRNNYQKLNYKALNSLKKIERALMILDEESVNNLDMKLNEVKKQKSEVEKYVKGMKSKIQELRKNESELLNFANKNNNGVKNIIDKVKFYEKELKEKEILYKELSDIKEMEKEINNKTYIKELSEYNLEKNKISKKGKEK